MPRDPDVDAFVSSLDHPLEPGIQAVQDVAKKRKDLEKAIRAWIQLKGG